MLCLDTSLHCEMNIKIKLIKYSPFHMVTILASVVKTFKMIFLGKF